MEQNKAERLNENVTEKMCSSDGNVVGEMCSPADADTCRERMSTVTKQVKKYRNRLKIEGTEKVGSASQNWLFLFYEGIMVI